MPRPVLAKTGIAANGSSPRSFSISSRHPLDVGGRQIDLVDDRQQFQVVIQCQVEVGDRLGLDALGCVHDDQRTVAGQERARTSWEKSTCPGVSIRFS